MAGALQDHSIKRLKIIGFRGCAKSTMASLAVVLWAALEHPDLYPFIIMLADTRSQATTIRGWGMVVRAGRRKTSRRLSVKGPMGGHPPKCPASRVADGKQDNMIAGREDGRRSTRCWTYPDLSPHGQSHSR